MATSAALGAPTHMVAVMEGPEPFIYVVIFGGSIKKLHGGTLATVWTASLTGAFFFGGNPAQDQDGYIWNVGQSLSSSTLYKISPAGAVTAFDVTGTLGGGSGTPIAYDEVSRRLILLEESVLYLWDIDSSIFVGSLSGIDGTWHSSDVIRGVVDDQLYVNYTVMDVATLTILKTYNPNNWHADAGYAAVYDETSHALWAVTNSNGVHKWLLDRTTPTAPTLAAIVTELSTRAGLSAGDLNVAGATTLYLLDIPLLRDMDDVAGFYASMHGLSVDWPGAVLYASADEALWEVLRTETDPVTVGVAVTALPSGPTHTWDRANTLRVRLTRGSLSSYTEAQALT